MLNEQPKIKTTTGSQFLSRPNQKNFLLTSEQGIETETPIAQKFTTTPNVKKVANQTQIRPRPNIPVINPDSAVPGGLCWTEISKFVKSKVTFQLIVNSGKARIDLKSEPKLDAKKMHDPSFSESIVRKLILNRGNHITAEFQEKYDLDTKLDRYLRDHNCSVVDFTSWKMDLCPPLRCLSGKKFSDIFRREDVGFNWCSLEEARKKRVISYEYSIGELFEPDEVKPNSRFKKFDRIDGLVEDCLTLDKFPNDKELEGPKNSIRSKYFSDYNITENLKDIQSLITAAEDSYTLLYSAYEQRQQPEEITYETTTSASSCSSVGFSTSLKASMFTYFYYTRKNLFSVNRENLTIETLVKVMALDPYILYRDYHHFLVQICENIQSEESNFSLSDIIGPIFLGKSLLDPWVSKRYPQVNSEHLRFIKDIVMLDISRFGIDFIPDDPIDVGELIRNITINVNESDANEYKDFSRLIFLFLWYTFKEFVLKKAFLVSIRKSFQKDSSFSYSSNAVKKHGASDISWMMTPQPLLALTERPPNDTDAKITIFAQKDELEEEEGGMTLSSVNLLNIVENAVNERLVFPKFFPISNDGYPHMTAFDPRVTAFASSLINKFKILDLEEKAKKLGAFINATRPTPIAPTKLGEKPPGAPISRIKAQHDIVTRNAQKSAVLILANLQKWLTHQVQLAIQAGIVLNLNNSTGNRYCDKIEDVEVNFSITLCHNYTRNLLLIYEAKNNLNWGLEFLPYGRKLEKAYPFSSSSSSLSSSVSERIQNITTNRTKTKEIIKLDENDENDENDEVNQIAQKSKSKPRLDLTSSNNIRTNGKNRQKTSKRDTVNDFPDYGICESFFCSSIPSLTTTTTATTTKTPKKKTKIEQKNEHSPNFRKSKSGSGTISTDSEIFSEHSSIDDDEEDYFNTNPKDSIDPEDSEDASYYDCGSDVDGEGMENEAFAIGYIDEVSIKKSENIIALLEEGYKDEEIAKKLRSEQKKAMELKRQALKQKAQIRPQLNYNLPVRRSTREKVAPSRLELFINEDDEVASKRLMEHTRNILRKSKVCHEKNIIDSDVWVEDHKGCSYSGAKSDSKKRKAASIYLSESNSESESEFESESESESESYSELSETELLSKAAKLQYEKNDQNKMENRTDDSNINSQRNIQSKPKSLPQKSKFHFKDDKRVQKKQKITQPYNKTFSLNLVDFSSTDSLDDFDTTPKSLSPSSPKPSKVEEFLKSPTCIPIETSFLFKKTQSKIAKISEKPKIVPISPSMKERPFNYSTVSEKSKPIPKPKLKSKFGSNVRDSTPRDSSKTNSVSDSEFTINEDFFTF